MTSLKRVLTQLSIILFLPAATLAFAAPSDVDDLVGARASSGESALEDRGYHHIKNLVVSDNIISYWWNPRRQACIAVTTSDGRYKSIMDQPDKVCDDGGGSSDRYDEDRYENDRYGSSAPEIRRVDNGNIAVDMGGCNVLFNRHGDIENAGRSCSNRDVDEARDAYEGYMREQGSYAGDEAPPGGFGGGDDMQYITCESRNNQYQFCRIHIGTQGRVRLTKRESSARCNEGDSWGYEQDGVWVDKGCRAEFSVER